MERAARGACIRAACFGEGKVGVENLPCTDIVLTTGGEIEAGAHQFLG